MKWKPKYRWTWKHKRTWERTGCCQKINRMRRKNKWKRRTKIEAETETQWSIAPREKEEAKEFRAWSHTDPLWRATSSRDYPHPFPSTWRYHDFAEYSRKFSRLIPSQNRKVGIVRWNTPFSNSFLQREAPGIYPEEKILPLTSRHLSWLAGEEKFLPSLVQILVKLSRGKFYCQNIFVSVTLSSASAAIFLTYQMRQNGRLWSLFLGLLR